MRRYASALLFTALCLVPAHTWAQDTLFWLGTVSADWSDAANWSDIPGTPSAVSPPGPDDLAIFASATGATRACTLDVDAAVGHIMFGSGGSLSVGSRDLDVNGEFMFYGGTFHGGTGRISAGGTVYILTGSFTSTQDSLFVGDGIVEESFGSFHNNDGTVVVEGEAEIDLFSFLHNLHVGSGAEATLANNAHIEGSARLDGLLKTNGLLFFVHNPSETALSGTGGIYVPFLEASPLVWSTLPVPAEYVIPFYATETGPRIPVTITITDAGTSAGSPMLWANSYAVDIETAEASSGILFRNAAGAANASMNADRLWLVGLVGYAVPPTIDLELGYEDAALAGKGLIEGRLRMQGFWETDEDVLLWDAPVGAANVSTNSVTAEDVDLGIGYRIFSLVDSTSPNRVIYGRQTGLTCADAINLDSMPEAVIFEMGDTVMWFRFTNDSHDRHLNFASLLTNLDSVLIFDFDSCQLQGTVRPIRNITFSNQLNSMLERNEAYYLKAFKSGASVSKFSIRKSLPETVECILYSDSLQTSSKWWPESCQTTGYHPLVPERILYLNFHFMLRNDSTGNFRPNDDGTSNTSQSHITGYLVANAFVEDFNRRMQEHPSYKYSIHSEDSCRNLGQGFDTILPVTAMEPRFRVEIYKNPSIPGDKGVYFHPSDLYYGGGHWDSLPIKSVFSVNGDKVVDIFLIEPVGDVANGNAGYGSIAINNAHTVYTDSNLYNFWARQGTLYHEVGHVLGLAHTSFEYGGEGCGNFLDSCSDTYDISGLCNCPAPGSNNIMDYSGNPRFITPCQLDIMHKTLSTHPASTLVDMSDIWCNENSIHVTIDSNTNVTWDVLTLMLGNVIVKSGAVLTVNCELKMPYNAKIIVERGGKLVVDRGKITALCKERPWGGIEVWGTSNAPQPTRASVTGGSYPTSGSHHGVVIVRDSSVIENARYGISLTRTYAWGHDLAYTGGIVIAEKSLFRNVTQGISFMKYPHIYYWRSPEFRSVSAITDCLFITDEKTDGHPDPHGFITLWGMHGVQINNNCFVNEVPRSYGWTNRGRGIVAIDSEFTLAYNRFEQLTKGVDVSATGWNPDTYIIYDTIVNCGTGISATSNMGIRIYKNVIIVDSLAPAPTFHFSTGILNQGNIVPMIQDNEISLPNTSAGISCGIYSTATGHFSSQIYRNTIRGGSHVYALANSLDNSGLVIKCNTVQNEMDHIVVLSGEIAENQGICVNGSTTANNTFFSTCGTTDNTHLYLYPNGRTFYYRHGNGTGQIPNLSCTSNGVNIFPCPPLSFQTPCPPKIDTSGAGAGKADEIYNINDSLKAGMAINNSLLDHGRTTSLIGHIRNMLVADGALRDTLLSSNGMTSDDAFLALIYERPSFDKGDLAYLLRINAPHSNVIWKELGRIADQFHPDSLELLEQYQDSTSLRKPIIDNIYAYRHQLSVNYGELLYWEGRDTTLTIERIVDSLKTETDVQLQLLLAEYYAADSQYTEAANIYDSLPVYNQDLKKLVQLRKFNLTFAENGWTWFEMVGEGNATSYLDSIAAIAHADSSLAAFQAQVILELVGVDTVTRVFETKQVSSKRESPKESPEEHAIILGAPQNIRVYPNPAQDEIIVEYMPEDPIGGTPTFSIFNLMGQTQYQTALRGRKTNIDVSMFSNGIYLFVLSKEGATLSSGKLSIVK